MPGDLIGFLLSAALIALCFLLSFLVVKHGEGQGRFEIARKIVHIGVSNWFFIYYYCFEGIVWPLVGLGLFALINFILTVSGAYSAIIGASSVKRSWGVVYYPLAIIVLLILLALGFGTETALGCAILGMGYGDGLAALIGQKFGQKKVFAGSKKTMLGSVTLLLVVMLIVCVLNVWLAGKPLDINLVAWSLLIGFVSAIFEAVTPLGLDNVTVPVVIFLLAGLI